LTRQPIPTARTSNTRRQKVAEARAAQRRRERKRRVWFGVGCALVVVVALTAITVALSGGSRKPRSVPAGSLGPEGIALEQGTPLASLAGAATGNTVEGVQCNANEQVAYHVHTHLAVYVNGVLRPLSPGIGIVEPVAQQTVNGAFYSASNCYYWLHVHAQDGVIHVESPNQRDYTLGQFFAIWKQPLTANQIGPVTGALTVFVNGTRYSGNPAGIVLTSHEDIQVDVGAPVVAAQRVDWSKSQL
jgi:hypothetical protein